MFVTRTEIDAVWPEAYSLIPAQVRDRIPANVLAAAENSLTFRKGFSFLQSFVDQMFADLQYVEGEPWPMWKLISAHSMVEAKVGHETVKRVGATIFSTIPWPKSVTTIQKAVRELDVAYCNSHSHSRASEPSRRAIGGWSIEREENSRIFLTTSTLYGDSIDEGVVDGLCQAFQSQSAKYVFPPGGPRKRDGATTTKYILSFKS